MNDSLFRKEVLQHRALRLHGEVWMVAPRPLKVMLWATLALALILVLVGLLGDHATKLSLPGKVLPTNGIVRVPAPRPGLIHALYVTNGQVVHKGQPLLTLKSQTQLEDGFDHRVEQLRLIDQELQEIAAVEQTLIAQAEIRRDELAKRIHLTNEEIASKKAELDTQQKLVRNEEKKLNAYRALATNGSVSLSDMLAQEGAVFAAQKTLLELSAELTSLQDRLVSLSALHDAIPFELRKSQAEIAAQKAQIQQERISIEALYELTVVAPIDGEVVELRSRRGHFAEAAETILVIVPAHGDLYAELYAPSKAIGSIKVGQRVVMKFEAYPADRFGTFAGTVRSVSEVVMSEADISRTQQLTAPAFIVYVALEDPFLLRRGNPIRLQAGLEVRSDVIVASQSLLSWISGKVLNPGSI